jgi:hypothetical protein
MQELTTLELCVPLPRAVADEVECIRRQDPDLLARMLQYGVTQRLVLERLMDESERLVGAAAAGAAGRV